jgi:hypothetical protein
MRTFLTLTVALAILAAAQSSAQQPEVKPGPEHMKFKEAVGVWDATIKAKEGDSKGVLDCQIDLNGLWLREHFKAEFAGKKFEGRGATSYDPASKKYVNVWIDTMSTRPMVTEGTYDASTKTMKMVGDMPMPDGKSVKVTLTTVAKDADTKVFTIQGPSPDGKEVEYLHITYKRRAK